MVEDALKSTRSLERLLLLACLVALVFLSSINEHLTARSQLVAVKQIRDLSSAVEYESYVEATHQPLQGFNPVRFIGQLRREVEQPCSVDITDAGAMVRILGPPVRITGSAGDSLPASSATLNEVRQFLEEVPDRNAHVYILDPTHAAETVASLMVSRFPVCRGEAVVVRITDASLERVDLADPSGDPPSRAPLGSADLFVALDVGGSQVRETARVRLARVLLPNTSLRAWLESTRPEAYQLLSAPPVDFDRHRPLSEIQEELVETIERGRAETQTINLFGLALPGALAIVGVPLLLSGLAGALLIHIRHLDRLVARHRETFLEFVWTPLAPGRLLWVVEMSLVVLVLPLLVEGLLLVRSWAFDILSWTTYAAPIVGAAANLGLGVAALVATWRLRRRLGLG